MGEERKGVSQRGEGADEHGTHSDDGPRSPSGEESGREGRCSQGDQSDTGLRSRRLLFLDVLAGGEQWGRLVEEDPAMPGLSMPNKRPTAWQCVVRMWVWRGTMDGSQGGWLS